jgi:enterochelin esterase-like enzyme
MLIVNIGLKIIVASSRTKNNPDRFYRSSRLILLGLLVALSACARLNTLPTAAETAISGTFMLVDSSPTTTMTPFLPPTARPTSAPTPTPTREPDCHSLGGKVDATSIPSQNIDGPLQFHIYLPPCYDQDTSQRYPVLYLIHGQSFTDDQWVRLGAARSADKLIAGGAPPFIIVMPFDKYHYRQPATDPFDEAVIQELIPFIDATYRARAERAFRAMGGLSRGAGWALHFTLTYPKLFGAFGGHSLAILDEDGPRLRRLLDAIPLEDMPRIFLDIGEEDGLQHNAAMFESMLTERGIPHEWYLFPGFHNEEYWARHVEEYLKWYTDGWKQE